MYSLRAGLFEKKNRGLISVSFAMRQACSVDASGESAFMQHIAGAKHRRVAGRPGFAGIAPNEAGGSARRVR